MNHRFANRPIFQVHLFYFLTLIWAIIVQFLPVHENAYQYIAFLIPIAIYLFLNRERAGEILKLKPLNLRSILLIPVIWLTMLPLTVLVVSGYQDLFGDQLADIVSEETNTNLWLVFIFTAVTPAFFEELIMRGIILDGYREKRLIVAALMNGLLFGMLHMNTFQFAYTFFIGILATYLVYATGSILASMWLHLINNSMPILLTLLAPEPTEPVEEVEEVADSLGASGYLMLSIFVLVGLFLTIFLVKRLFRINGRSLEEVEVSVASTERIFNWPLLLSIILFVLFSALLLLVIYLDPRLE